MGLRKNILPKTGGDVISSGLNVFVTPLNYYVFNFVVLPRYCIWWSSEFNIHLVNTSILSLMMYANMFALILCDTSVKGRCAPGTVTQNWTYCKKCEISVPPRSWHCKICDICILKRDHHCVFTSCCVGFHNHRYFFMYLLFTTITTFYASYFNLYYVYETAIVEYTWKTLLKILFPFISIFIIEWSSLHFHFLIIFETLIFGLISCSLLFWCGYLMARNMVLFDKRRPRDYERGILENLKVVFGERWYLVWLGPWVNSTLPCDGMNWAKNLE